MNRKNQNGNALIVIIVIFVVVILGVLGYIVWQNYLQPKTAANTTPTGESSQSTTQPEKTPEYITFTDWSIKFQLPDSLDASNLKYEKTHIAEAPEYYALTTAKITAQGDVCAGGYPFGDTVSLQRSSDKQTASENVSNYGGELINSSAINGYFYYYQTSVETTTPVPDCAVTAIANSERALLIEFVKSLVAA